MNIQNFEQAIQNTLQRDIEIVSSNNLKVIRKGVLILYSLKEFYMTFVIKTSKGDTKYYHFPIPYSFTETKKGLVFDYSVEHIHNYRDKIIDIVGSLGESKSVFYDNIVQVQYKR